MRREIKKGDIFFLDFKNKVDTIIPVKVIALTRDITKMIGVESESNINGHSCDGIGKDGYCLWTRPEHLLTESDVARIKAEAEAKLAQSVVDNLDSIVFDTDESGQVTILDKETITADDVGTVPDLSSEPVITQEIT